jgi:hypothetical protein
MVEAVINPEVSPAIQIYRFFITVVRFFFIGGPDNEMTGRGPVFSGLSFIKAIQIIIAAPFKTAAKINAPDTEANMAVVPTARAIDALAPDSTIPTPVPIFPGGNQFPIIFATFELRNEQTKPDRNMHIKSAAKLLANIRPITAKREIKPAAVTQTLTPSLSHRTPEVREKRIPGIMADEKRIENCAGLIFKDSISLYVREDSWYIGYIVAKFNKNAHAIITYG